MIVAYVLLALGVLVANGTLWGLPLALAATGCAVWALRGGREPGARGTAVLIGVCAIASLVRDPAAYMTGPRWPFMLGALLLGGVGVLGCLRPARWHLPVALALAAAIGAGVIVRSPMPRIDVFVLEQGGAHALVHGRNPYSIEYPNPYSTADTKQFFGGARTTLTDYPYPPLSLVATTLGYVTGGDVRWALLAGQLAIAVLLFALARRNRHPLPLALAVLHLVHPRGPFVLEQAWTDTLPALAWLATLYWRNAPALGLFFAAKQYSVVALPLIVRDLPRRTILIAIGIAAATMLPFIAWDLHGFLEDVVLFQFHQPFRFDAMSVPALVAYLTGLQAPGLLSFATAGATTAWLWRRATDDRAWSICVALVYLAFFLGAKQAFCNYYYFVGVLLLASSASSASSAARSSSDSRGSGSRAA